MSDYSLGEARLREILGTPPSGFELWSTFAKYVHLRDRVHAAGRSISLFEQKTVARVLGVSRHAVRRAENSDRDERCGCVPG